jgi:riboflavin synthase
MFTGIVEEVGVLRQTGSRWRVACQRVVEDAREGDSICVSGVCLTAIDIEPDGFSADLAPETLAVSALGELSVGRLVNLERSLPANGRLSGHIVQGHVDGKALVRELTRLEDGNWRLAIEVPDPLLRYVVYKGSLCVDGISLTVARVDRNQIEFAIIPHTWANTALRDRMSGQNVNIETDILARHVERLLETGKNDLP